MYFKFFMKEEGSVIFNIKLYPQEHLMGQAAPEQSSLIAGGA